MFAVRFLLVCFSMLLLTNGVADNFNEEFSATPSDQNYIAGWYWENPKTAVPPSKNNAESTSNTSSSTSTTSSSTKTKDYRSILEFKAGYFFFTDHKMREVFDQGGLDLQLCGSTPIWRWLQIYGSVEYLEKSGRSINGHQRTRIWEIPISLGLEAVARITKKFQYYFTIGPRYVFVHVHNRSHFVDKTLNENGLGGFANTGFHYFPSPHLVLDIFGEYSYARMHFHAHKKHAHGESRQVGGLVFGGGIGYAF